MLNVPTLWTAFIFNFVALGLIWAYILHSYPSFEAARFWTGSAFAAVAAGLLGIAATVTEPLVPLVLGGTSAVFASCLLAMGVRRFYGEPARWRLTAAIVALTFAGLSTFTFGYNSSTARILVYSMALMLPLGLVLKLLLRERDGRINAGARLAGSVAVVIMAISALRSEERRVGK